MANMALVISTMLPDHPVNLVNNRDNFLPKIVACTLPMDLREKRE